MNFLSNIVVEISLTEKYGEKEKRSYTRKNTQENAGSQCHDSTSHCQFTYKILTFYLLRKITVLIAWRERKDTKYIEEQTRQSCLSIPLYNLLLLFCIPILYSCGDIFDKNCRDEEKWINIGKNKQQNAGSQSHDTTGPCLPVYQILKFYLKRFWRYL